jgi:hypothetical protein
LTRLSRFLREVKKAILPLECPEAREDRHEGFAKSDVREVGLDEAIIRRYIHEQEKNERDQERGLFDDLH